MWIAAAPGSGVVTAEIDLESSAVLYPRIKIIQVEHVHHLLIYLLRRLEWVTHCILIIEERLDVYPNPQLRPYCGDVGHLEWIIDKVKAIHRE